MSLEESLLQPVVFQVPADCVLPVTTTSGTTVSFAQSPAGQTTDTTATTSEPARSLDMPPSPVPATSKPGQTASHDDTVPPEPAQEVTVHLQDLPVSAPSAQLIRPVTQQVTEPHVPTYGFPLPGFPWTGMHPATTSMMVPPMPPFYPFNPYYGYPSSYSQMMPYPPQQPPAVHLPRPAQPVTQLAIQTETVPTVETIAPIEVTVVSPETPASDHQPIDMEVTSPRPHPPAFRELERPRLQYPRIASSRAWADAPQVFQSELLVFRRLLLVLYPELQEQVFDQRITKQVLSGIVARLGPSDELPALQFAKKLLEKTEEVPSPDLSPAALDLSPRQSPPLRQRQKRRRDSKGRLLPILPNTRPAPFYRRCHVCRIKYPEPQQDPRKHPCPRLPAPPPAPQPGSSTSA